MDAIKTVIPISSSALDSARSIFLADVVRGLSRTQKQLPCSYFYDERGSELFEEITRLPEYYPTLTECDILRRRVKEFASDVLDPSLLIEFGSGSSMKTEMLIAALPRMRAYMPIDVSSSALSSARERLQANFPDLDIRPIIGDFTRPIVIPSEFSKSPKIGFFPGSTIGNFAPDEARTLLVEFRRTLGVEGRLLIGVDLRKDEATLLRAYDDSAGVTAAFNLNLLARINRELDGDFNLDRFQHVARYDRSLGRIEMHLASKCDQVVSIGSRTFAFNAGETIHTENSYKYSISQFLDLANDAGWNSKNVWSDEKSQFSVHDLSVA